MRFPDGQTRVLALEKEPRPGELLETDELPGTWLISKAELRQEGDEPDVPYEISVESAEGVSD